MATRGLSSPDSIRCTVRSEVDAALASSRCDMSARRRASRTQSPAPSGVGPMPSPTSQASRARPVFRWLAGDLWTAG